MGRGGGRVRGRGRGRGGGRGRGRGRGRGGGGRGVSDGVAVHPEGGGQHLSPLQKDQSKIREKERQYWEDVKKKAEKRLADANEHLQVLKDQGNQEEKISSVQVEGSASTSGQNSKLAPKQQDKTKKGKQGKKVSEQCIAECNPGKNNSCYRRSRKRKEGHLSCIEVKQLLQGMGIESLKDINRCTLSAIQKGIIQVQGKPEDLNMVVFELKGLCGHMYKITLEQLLEQTDNCVDDYGGSATIHCPVNTDNDCSYRYVAEVCVGRPRFDWSEKGHNHCRGCPGFGRCLNDCRSSCYNRQGVHTNKVYGVGGNWDTWTDCSSCEEREKEEDGCMTM